jgi:hypothetical protein
LACKRLLKVPSQKALSTLQELPPRLPDLYIRMIDQVFETENKENQIFYLRTLRLIILAFRPLSIVELFTIAEFPPRFRENDLLDLIDLYSSFILVRKNILYFVYQSSKDYLVTEGTQKLFSVSLQEEHKLVIDRSLDTISKTLKKDIYSLGHPGAPATPDLIDIRLTVINYSCSFWIAHLIQYLGDNLIDSIGRSYHVYFSDQGRIYEFLFNHLLH